MGEKAGSRSDKGKEVLRRQIRKDKVQRACDLPTGPWVLSPCGIPPKSEFLSSPLYYPKGWSALLRTGALNSLEQKFCGREEPISLFLAGSEASSGPQNPFHQYKMLGLF